MSWLEEIGKEEYYEELPSVASSNDIDELEWREKRLALITGSQFGKLVVKTRDKKGYTLSSGQIAETLIYRIAWERLLKSGNISNGLGRLNISSKEMEHGHDYEGQAILAYEKETGYKVDYSQRFIELNEWIGGTPDGFVGEKGIVEVKCPWNGGNHLKSLLTKEVYNQEYVYQIQGYLWITGREWCDFITYDPDLVKGLQLNIIRVDRDTEIIEGIQEVMMMVREKIEAIINNEKLKKFK